MALELRMFQEAYPPNYLYGGIYKTSRQAFLSSMPGAAWGTWTVEEKPERQEAVLCRHAEQDRRMYCDPDREYLFTKHADGTLRRKKTRGPIDE
jgi:hypothetical protein